MSAALVGTPEFQLIFGSNPNATAATIALLCAHAGIPVGAGAMANVGLPMAQVLQNFAENSALVSNALAAPIANFQNLLLNAAPGAPPPSGSILTLPGTVGSSLTLTAGVDTPTTGFSTGHGATALAAGSIFNAGPASNPPFGVTNTLNPGDVLATSGGAIGATTLNFTAVASPAGNPPLATDVTMTGVNAAIINNSSGQLAGFSGNITGLTSATLAGASTNNVRLGVAGNGLNTALTDVTINASHNFTAFMTTAALAAAPSATVHLTGVTTDVTLDVAPAGPNGYAQLTVDTGGSPNNLTLDTNVTNTATVVATGAAALQLQGTALNIANLHTFTGTAAAGGVDVFFNGTGHVAATGGAGDDTFNFLTTAAGVATFLSTSSVDGGAGTNTLVIQANHGAILDIGTAPFVPGSNITNIQTVENTTDGAATGLLTADLAALGSANTFDLAGNYGANNVQVSDITNLQTVEYSGTNLNNLTLAHAIPLGIESVINFEMDGAGPGALTLTRLTVATGLVAVNIDSIGAASDNVISNNAHIDDNVAITGGTHLTFGGPGNGYSFIPALPNGGVIDASADTGGVTAWLGNVGLNTGTNVAQTFIGGTGADNAQVLNIGGDVIDFTHGGADTITFRSANTASGHPMADTAHFYNQVLAFVAANDTLAIHNSAGLPGGQLFNTNSNVNVVNAGDAANIFHFDTGDLGANATTDAFNYIKIDTDISAGGATVQAAFAQAMGVLGTINVIGAHSHLLSFYDTSNSEAAFVSVSSGPTITAASHVNVIGLIHESAADYAVTTPHFVA